MKFADIGKGQVSFDTQVPLLPVRKGAERLPNAYPIAPSCAPAVTASPDSVRHALCVTKVHSVIKVARLSDKPARSTNRRTP